MSKILIYTETQGENVKTVTLEILGKLNGHEVSVCSFGDIGAEGKEALKANGANEIITLSTDGNYSPQGYANALKELVTKNSFNYIFCGATAQGKDFFPSLATLLDRSLVSDVTSFDMDGDTFKGIRPMFAGKCLVNVQFKGDGPHFVSIRPNAIGLNDSPTAGSGNEVSESANFGDAKISVSEVVKGTSEKADLTEANIIVSGGRSLKSSDNFQILNELAEVIGATVGASRAAVDSGYAEPSMQVGQTGKTVSPSLYMAFGISGAIQHLAGMRTSKTIVAINTDPDAPIFGKADYGIVGDLFKIAPLFTEEFKKIM